MLKQSWLESDYLPYPERGDDRQQHHEPGVLGQPQPQRRGERHEQPPGDCLSA